MKCDSKDSSGERQDSPVLDLVGVCVVYRV
jgi:hypothetical protein